MAFCSTTDKTFWCNIWDIFVKAGCKKYYYLIGYINRWENIKLRVLRCEDAFAWECQVFKSHSRKFSRRGCTSRTKSTAYPRCFSASARRWWTRTLKCRYAAYYPPISVMSFARAKWLRTSKGGIFPDGKTCPPLLAKEICKGNPRGPRIKEGFSNKNKPEAFVFS